MKYCLQFINLIDKISAEVKNKYKYSASGERERQIRVAGFISHFRTINVYGDSHFDFADQGLLYP